VLFIYLTRAYFRRRGGDALRSVRKRYPDLFIVADDVFGPDYQDAWARQWDAVTAYDVYGQTFHAYGAEPGSVAKLAQIYKTAKSAANRHGVGFIPAVTPGFNDTFIRSGHPVAPRYFPERQDSKPGDVFKKMIEQAALPLTDASVGHIIMVTSFNEWHEDTQIEASTGTVEGETNEPQHLTDGYYYEDYGYRYLDILAELTAGGV
jgi:glycoprotein endo-alpha-1,2-mannosidase